MAGHFRSRSSARGWFQTAALVGVRARSVKISPIGLGAAKFGLEMLRAAGNVRNWSESSWGRQSSFKRGYFGACGFAQLV